MGSGEKATLWSCVCRLLAGEPAEKYLSTVSSSVFSSVQWEQHPLLAVF